MKTLVGLFKMRIVVFTLMTLCVGFISARNRNIEWTTLLWTLLGTCVAIAGNGALNQWLERTGDAKMKRTSGRPIPSGRISPGIAIALSVIMISTGTAILLIKVNMLSAAIIAAGTIIYNFVYTPMKYRTPWCVYVGAVSGSLPPLVGWVAATGKVEPGAAALFILLYLWQMPHSISLAFLYRDDYTKAGCFLLPEKAGQTILTSCLLLLPASVLVALTGIAGWGYVLGAVALGGAFYYMGYEFKMNENKDSAKKLFKASLIYLVISMLLLLADPTKLVFFN